MQSLFSTISVAHIFYFVNRILIKSSLKTKNTVCLFQIFRVF